MTNDDIENSKTAISVETWGWSERIDGVDSSWNTVLFNGDGIDKSIWDAALASADDALVLVQWLESKRVN